MKVKCECTSCGKEILVDFILPPTEKDKLGWYCVPCADHESEPPKELIDESQWDELIDES